MSNLLRIALLLSGYAHLTLPAPVSCPVAPPPPRTPADIAFLHGDFDQAASLYQQALQQMPDDPALTVALSQTLLRQQKIQQAESLIQKALTAHPKSIALQTGLGEVQYRAGAPWLAAKTSDAAYPFDPCYARLHLLRMHLFRLNSMYASAAAELRTAHALDNYDPDIQRLWVETLPLQQRITQLEAFLASGAGIDPADLPQLRLYLESLKKRAEAPPKACRLASTEANTQIPFAPLMRDATHIRAFGLEVKVNDHGVRLQIDTGASGLLISRSMAERAGLTEFSKTQMGGVGSQGEKDGYIAFADSIKIGTLEFHDCAVTVVNGRNVVDSDGLIGMDVFSNFLVTLDYPMRKLALAPLPVRPEDAAAAAKPALETDEEQTPIRGPHNRYIGPELQDWTPVYRQGHQLLIRATLNNTGEKLFILDTGSFSTTISSEAARELGKLHVEDRMTIHGISGKVDKVYYADNVTFHFANLAQKAEEAFAFDTSNLSKHIGLEVSGFIGITTLAQLTMHIDYRDGLVKFDYNPNRGYR
jgi:predicted aspartyl protease